MTQVSASPEILDADHVQLSTKSAVVLDTSVLITDPEAIFAFAGDTVVLPLTVVEELDNQKTRMDHVGRSARAVVRSISKMRVANGGKLDKPVPLPGGGSFFIEINGLHSARLQELGLDIAKADNRILAAAVGLQSRNPKVNVRLISGDLAMCIKASKLGLTADEYVIGSGEPLMSNTGSHTVEVGSDVVNALHSKDGFVHFGDMSAYDQELLEAIPLNEFVIAKAGKQSGLGRRMENGLQKVRNQTAWGLETKSKEQGFAMNLLMDETVEAVTISGRSGTGKTYLTIAAALQQTFEPETTKYERIMILRPLYAVGRQEVGFLPGTLEEKLGPWMENIVDTMVALGDRISYKEAREMLKMWVDAEVLTMEAVTFLRGRSLKNTFIIVDEAQNLEASVAKTILTRLGEGSKVVFLGDVEQRDNPYVGEHDNALAVISAALSGQDLFGHIILTKGERSRIAEMCANLL